MMRVQTLRGDAAYADMPARVPRLKSMQAKMRRNAIWLNALDRGMYDPSTCCVRRYTVHELSAIWGMTERTVRDGIQDAREELRRVDALNVAS